MKELVQNHWEYIKGVLQTHGEKKEIIDKIEYHYITAFLHGYKHAMEEKEKEDEK